MTLEVIQSHAPEKPLFGEPCNGCGFCCAAEVCEIGQRSFDIPSTAAPCPALVLKDGRFWCGVVQTLEGTDIGMVVSFALGIGKGCCSDDPEVLA